MLTCTQQLKQRQDARKQADSGCLLQVGRQSEHSETYAQTTTHITTKKSKSCARRWASLYLVFLDFSRSQVEEVARDEARERPRQLKRSPRRHLSYRVHWQLFNIITPENKAAIHGETYQSRAIKNLALAKCTTVTIRSPSGCTT